MTDLKQIKQDVSLKDYIDLVKRDIFLNFNCTAVATVQSFDSEKQTVTATINYKKKFFRDNPVTLVYESYLVDYPVLVDCPIIVLHGGDGALTFPIEQGDTCLILFNDRDISDWFHSGQIGPCPTFRLHSLADGIALIGLNSSQNAIPDYDPDRVVLKNGETLIGLGDLIKIQNAATSLKTILTNLMTTLSTLTTAMSSATPATVVATIAVPSATAVTQLTAINTLIGELLE